MVFVPPWQKLYFIRAGMSTLGVNKIILRYTPAPWGEDRLIGWQDKPETQARKNLVSKNPEPENRVKYSVLTITSRFEITL